MSLDVSRGVAASRAPSGFQNTAMWRAAVRPSLDAAKGVIEAARATVPLQPLTAPPPIITTTAPTTTLSTVPTPPIVTRSGGATGLVPGGTMITTVAPPSPTVIIEPELPAPSPPMVTLNPTPLAIPTKTAITEPVMSVSLPRYSSTPGTGPGGGFSGAGQQIIDTIGGIVSVGRGIYDVITGGGRPPSVPTPAAPVMEAGVLSGMGRIGATIGRAAPKIGTAVGTIATRIGKGRVWKRVVDAATGAVVWMLIDKATGAILGQRDRPPHRRMNVLNPRALRRADRRVDGFVKVARKMLSGAGFTVARRGSGRCAPKRKRCR